MTRIAIVVPIRPAAVSGNDVTAHRWADQLRRLGHRVDVFAVAEGEAASAPGLGDADVLVALHACRSAATVRAWSETNRPLVVALTGTDLYVDLPDATAAARSVELADRLIVLQSAAVERLRRLNGKWADKARVIHQSVDPRLVPAAEPVTNEFRVVVLAHLREVKDPLLTARAARLVAADSRLAVHHAGRALDDAWAAAAAEEQRVNPRYRWHGEMERNEAAALMASAQVLACTSRHEGGANVVTEAVAAGIAVVGTRIDGNVGLLGADHPGLFPVGDAWELARLLSDLEADRGALEKLTRRSRALGPLVDPAVERAALAQVLDEVPVAGGR